MGMIWKETMSHVPDERADNLTDMEYIRNDLLVHCWCTNISPTGVVVTIHITVRLSCIHCWCANISPTGVVVL